ncbi:acetate--CoA ligase family protein [Halalkalicoccus ordinarius]|uniref:acetate--CoA ligase family protein n=1 Tax=Halalkalicoccus ordinarius TaxID=3116651 RepID=UPI00300EDB9E
MQRGRMDALFAPESIAVVGASPDSWYSSQLIDNLLEYGFDGDVHFVNPSRETVWGETCHDSIDAVPEVVDLVVVSVPRQSVVETVRDAAERGTPAAVVITAGFGEADEEGRNLEGELAAVAEEHGIAVCGPNTIGFANTHDETVVTSTCSRKPEKGSIGLVSQSGALAFTTFFERAADEDVGFAYVVATGNEVGLSASDYVEFMAADPRVDVICTYLEGVEDPRRFMEVSRAAVEGGTPVLTVKIGRSDVAEQATMSHTGSLTGNTAAWDAAFRRAGVERVPDVPDLLGRAAAHAAYEPAASPNVCIASTSGGLASLLADMADERDLELPDIAGETQETLLGMEDLLTFGELHNPADVRGYGADVLPEIAEALFADERFDAYLFAIGLPAVDERAESIADDVLRVAEVADAPTLFLWTGRKEAMEGQERPLPYERVREEVPLYYDPSRAMDALSSLVGAGRRRRALERRSGSEAGDGPEPAARTSSGPDPSGGTLTWTEAASLLESHGIEPVETRLATSAEEAATLAEAVGLPVAMKVDSADLPHRTDAGAVEVDVDSTEAAREAYDRIVRNAAEYDPAAEIEGVLIQSMAADGVEALVGVTTDETFGPLVTVASGGEFVELFDDGEVLVPPVSKEEARAAIERTHLGPLLEGHRDRHGGDADALAELVVRIGDLAVSHPRLEELDLNPVLVDGTGVSIVDVLVRIGAKEDG